MTPHDTRLRVLVCAVAGRGHLGATLPLVEALHGAGHRVRLVIAEHGARLVDARLDVVPVPSPPASLAAQSREVGARAMQRAVEGDPIGADRIYIRESFGRLGTRIDGPTVRRQVETFQPDVVLADPFASAGLVAAVESGTPLALASFAAWAPLRRCLEELAAGAAEGAGRSGPSQADLTTAIDEATVFSPIPPSLEAPDPDRTPRRIRRWRISEPGDPHDLPERLRRLIRADVEAGPAGSGRRPLVYATLGSVLGAIPPLARRFLDAFFEAMSRLDLPAVLTVGKDAPASLTTAAPPNVAVERFVPHRPLMRHAAVVVSHGGLNTVLDAVAAARPQVVLPMHAGDGRWNGARLEALGAGRCLADDALDAASLAEAIAAAVASPAPSPVVRALAEELAALPDPATAVAELAHSGRAMVEAARATPAVG